MDKTCFEYYTVTMKDRCLNHVCKMGKKIGVKTRLLILKICLCFSFLFELLLKPFELKQLKYDLKLMVCCLNTVYCEDISIKGKDLVIFSLSDNINFYLNFNLPST